MGWRPGPRHHAAGREPAGGIHRERGRVRVAQCLRSVCRPDPAHRHRVVGAPHRGGLLGGPDGPGLCLRRSSSLSWTLVTGEGGMLWLCQITFAGVGALTTAQLANHYGWPVLGCGAGGRCGRADPGRGGRIAQHPPWRPLRRPGHADLRAADGEPGVHAAQLREPGPGAHAQSTELRHVRPRLHVPLPGGRSSSSLSSSSTSDDRRPAWRSMRRAGARPAPRHRASASCR